MPSLKEIKGRIGSVQGTLKITSAMKMVATAKLHKAQTAIEGALPYQRQLESIMKMAVSGVAEHPLCVQREEKKAVALVCIASNTSLCGGYNSNMVRNVTLALEDFHREGLKVRVYVIGRKLEQSLVKWAKPHGQWLTLVREYVGKGDKPQYSDAARLSQTLCSDFLAGQLDGAELMYMHYRNMSSQVLTRDEFLPLTLSSGAEDVESPNIVEPTREALLESIVPDSLATKMYAVMLDAQAAEHAARTVAMQTATDNGNELLEELQIQYNKGRQAAITNELLDIAGGSTQ